jgi:hypothetical protein
MNAGHTRAILLWSMTSLIARGSPFLGNCAGFHSKVGFLPPSPVAASSRIARTPEATPNRLKSPVFSNYDFQLLRTRRVALRATIQPTFRSSGWIVAYPDITRFSSSVRLGGHSETDGKETIRSRWNSGFAHQISISSQSGSRSNRPCAGILSARPH